jgi:hypothetical protein
MGIQYAHPAPLGIEFKRNMVGIQSTCAMREQYSKRMLPDELMQHFYARLIEMGGYIHISSPGLDPDCNAYAFAGSTGLARYPRWIIAIFWITI